MDYEGTVRRMEEFKRGGFKARRKSGMVTCRDCGKKERHSEFTVSAYCGVCAANRRTEQLEAAHFDGLHTAPNPVCCWCEHEAQEKMRQAVAEENAR